MNGQKSPFKYFGSVANPKLHSILGYSSQYKKILDQFFPRNCNHSSRFHVVNVTAIQQIPMETPVQIVGSQSHNKLYTLYSRRHCKELRDMRKSE